MGPSCSLCSSAYAVKQKPFWSTSPKCALHHKRPGPPTLVLQPQMLRESPEKGEGCERRGVGSPAAAPSLSLQFGFAQLRLFPVFLTCAHWRVRSFSPLSPRGKGTREGEQREEAGAPMPRRALPQWRSGCTGPAHPATPLLFSLLSSGRRLAGGGAAHTPAGAPGCCAPA